MPIFLAQTTFPTTDGVAENYVSNTMHWSVDDDADLPFVVDAIQTLYNTPVGVAGKKIASYLAGSLSRQPNVVLTRLYDLSDPKPRAPHYAEFWTLAANDASASDLPTEVALCVSWKGNPTDLAKQDNARNRMYLGPFIPDASGGRPARPISPFYATVQLAFQRLFDNNATPAAFYWVAYSTKHDEAYDIASGWVDDAWDTQRRRGVQASFRALFG